MKKYNQTIIIAEAGLNHNGSLKRALKMIKVAKNSGADYIKFQTAVPENVVSKNAKKAKYQKKNTNDNETQFGMIKKLHLPLDNYKILKKECDKNSIKFLSSPFDIESVLFLKKIGCKIIKIPSGEITNYPYLKVIAKNKFKIILSTGMSTINEIETSLKILYKFKVKKKNITLLHCNSAYPTPIKDVNILAIKKLKNKFKLEVGFSDHTAGILAPICAVSVGAKVIEKHFTLNKRLKGPDHSSSLNPINFMQMSKSIRDVEKILGKNEKKITNSERENILIVRKSIVAKQKIIKGQLFSETNLTTKRPGNGISPLMWNKYIGQKSKKNYKKDQLINE